MLLRLATRQPEREQRAAGASTPSAVRRRSVAALGLIAMLFAAAALVSATPRTATLFGVSGPACPSRWLPALDGTGCPGCGLTRGTALLLDGEFRTASAVQPAAWLVVGFALLAALLHAIRIAVPEKSAWTDRLFGTGRVALLVGLVLVWAVRLSFR